MFKNPKSFADEISQSMADNLVKNEIEKQAAPLNKLASAVDKMNEAAFIFDEMGMSKEAEAITNFIEVIAKKKKSKKKSKKAPKMPQVAKPEDAMKGLTNKKMVENLKNKGWLFNADDTNCVQDHPDDEYCSFCDDLNFDFDTNEDSGQSVSRKDLNYYNDPSGTPYVNHRLEDLGYDDDFEDEIEVYHK